MTSMTQIAAVIAASLVNNDRYLKCTHKGNYSAMDGRGDHSIYVIDADAVAKDAWTVALALEEMECNGGRTRP